jgi:hypothetical protein
MRETRPLGAWSEPLSLTMLRLVSGCLLGIGRRWRRLGMRRPELNQLDDQGVGPTFAILVKYLVQHPGRI